MIRRAHAAARVAREQFPRPPAAAHTELRGSASRERNHGVGDHPIPFRTRQLSPTSPKVLRREAAGGQVVPLAGGAFPSPPGPGPAPALTPRRTGPTLSSAPCGVPFAFWAPLVLRARPGQRHRRRRPCGAPFCSRAGLPDGPRAAAAPGLPGGRFRGRALPEMH